jgi:hypothetical protein
MKTPFAMLHNQKNQNQNFALLTCPSFNASAYLSFSRRTHPESAMSVAANMDVGRRTLLNAAVRARRVRGDLLPHNATVVAEAELICAVADYRAFGGACGRGASC